MGAIVSHMRWLWCTREFPPFVILISICQYLHFGLFSFSLYSQKQRHLWRTAIQWKSKSWSELKAVDCFVCFCFSTCPPCLHPFLTSRLDPSSPTHVPTRTSSSHIYHTNQSINQSNKHTGQSIINSTNNFDCIATITTHFEIVEIMRIKQWLHRNQCCTQQV